MMSLRMDMVFLLLFLRFFELRSACLGTRAEGVTAPT